MNQKVGLLLIGTAIAALSSSGCTNSAQDEYATCLSQASEANTVAGVDAATEACDLKYQRGNQERIREKYEHQSGTISRIYWDGWMFRQGTLPIGFKNKGYRLYTFARYGVAICEAAMPEEMGKLIGNVGDDIDTQTNPQRQQLWQACYEAR